MEGLKSLYADEMRVSNSPMGCPTEINPLLVPVKTWLDWALEHQAAKAGRRAGGKRVNVPQPGQLSIWGSVKEE